MVMMSLTSTSVTMNFVQPEDSLQYDEYQVFLRPATRDLPKMYSTTEEEIDIDGETEWLVQFSNLSEFTVYNVTVTTTNAAFGSSRLTSFEILTLATCKPENRNQFNTVHTVFEIRTEVVECRFSLQH